MKKEFDIGKCFSEGWEVYKNNLAVLIVSSLIAILVGSFTCGILYPPMIIGMFMIIDRLIKADPAKPQAGDLFKGMSKFGPSFLCYVIFIVIFSIACALPIIGQLAALVASPLMMYAFLYITFEEMDAIGAFKRVFQELFSGELVMPVVIGLLAGLAGGVGALACGVGIIATIPFTPVVYMIAYQQMKKGDGILDAEIIKDAAPPPAPGA